MWYQQFFCFKKFSFHEFCLKITYELILYAKLNESGPWNEVSCSKKESQMNDFHLKLKLTSICFTHTSAIVITIWYILLHRWEMWRSLSCMAFSIYEVVRVAWHSRIWVVVYKKKQLHDWKAKRTTSILKQYNTMFIRKSAVVLNYFFLFLCATLTYRRRPSIKSGKILYFSKESREVIWFSAWRCKGHSAIKCSRILWLVRSPDWLIDWLNEWIFVIDLSLLHLWSIITFFYFNQDSV